MVTLMIKKLKKERGSGAKEKLVCSRRCGTVLVKRNGHEAGNLQEEEQLLKAFVFCM